MTEAATAVSPSPTPSRSALVTVVAWIAIIISAFKTLLLVIALLVVVAAPGQIDQVTNGVLHDTATVRMLPQAYVLMIAHPYLAGLAGTVFWAAALTSSIGVLRRRDWARRLFVAILCIAVVAATADFYLRQSVVLSLGDQLASGNGGRMPQAVGSAVAFGWMFVLGSTAVVLWLILAFRSPRIRREFMSRGAA